MSSQKNSQKKNESKNEHLRLGIDLGSSCLRAAITNSENELLEVYESESEGISYGVIVDEASFENSVTTLIKKIKKQYKKLPDQIIVGVGGTGIRSSTVVVNTFISRADGVVTFLDIEKITTLARDKNEYAKNKTILHTIPIKNWIDGVEVVGSPEDLRGSKLECKVLVISDDAKQEEIINKAFENIGVDIDMLVAGPLADAHVSLSKREKKIGSASINIGADTTSICVYENGVPLLVSVIKAGGEQITSDIALGLRAPIEIAEEIKLGNNDTEYSKRRYDEIVEARLNDISTKITDELNRIRRAELLPGGVVLLGGSSLLTKIEYYLRYELKLPIANAIRNLKLTNKFFIEDPHFIRVYGLTFFAESISETGLYLSILKRSFIKSTSFIKRFLP